MASSRLVTDLLSNEAKIIKFVFFYLLTNYQKSHFWLLTGLHAYMLVHLLAVLLIE